MKFSTTTQPLQDLATDLLIVGLFENEQIQDPRLKLLDKETHGQISKMLKSKNFPAKLGDVLLLFPDKIKASKLLLWGLGKKSEFTMEKLRIAGSALAPVIQKYQIKNASILFRQELPKKSTVLETAENLASSLLLSLYKFAPYKKESETQQALESLDLVLFKTKNKNQATKGLIEGEILATVVNTSRDLGNHPSNVATPEHLAQHALRLAKNHKTIKTKILSKTQIEEEKMGALLAVAKGSDEEPKFIILEYTPRKKSPTIVLAGKGITFDSGGINIKPSEKLEEMKYDMAGAATVMGVIQAAAQLELPINLIGLIPATENLPSGKAIKPGDVVYSRSGKSIEIINTDAEGRLVLADALDYAKKFNPDLVIDFATLTGAIVVALGDELIGAFTNTEKLITKLQVAAKTSGEKIWQMPLEKEYEQFLKSDIADLRNIGTLRYGDSINAALFLQNFVDCPWIHLDIAGVAWATREKPYRPKGATGTGVRLAIEFLRRYKK